MQLKLVRHATRLKVRKRDIRHMRHTTGSSVVLAWGCHIDRHNYTQGSQRLGPLLVFASPSLCRCGHLIEPTASSDQQQPTAALLPAHEYPMKDNSFQWWTGSRGLGLD